MTFKMLEKKKYVARGKKEKKEREITWIATSLNDFLEILCGIEKLLAIVSTDPVKHKKTSVNYK